MNSLFCSMQIFITTTYLSQHISTFFYSKNLGLSSPIIQQREADRQNNSGFQYLCNVIIVLPMHVESVQLYVVLICKNQALCVNTSYCSYLIYVLSIQSDKDKQLTAQMDQHNDKVSGVSKRLPTFLNRMLSFKVKLEETKVCHVSVILQAHNQSFSRGGSKSGMIT